MRYTSIASWEIGSGSAVLGILIGKASSISSMVRDTLHGIELLGPWTWTFNDLSSLLNVIEIFCFVPSSPFKLGKVISDELRSLDKNDLGGPDEVHVKGLDFEK